MYSLVILPSLTPAPYIHVIQYDTPSRSFEGGDGQNQPTSHRTSSNSRIAPVIVSLHVSLPFYCTASKALIKRSHSADMFTVW